MATNINRPTHPKGLTDERRRRAEAVRRVLAECLADESGYDERAWPELKAAWKRAEPHPVRCSLSETVVLDSGPLGLIAHPRADPAIVTWVNDLLSSAHRVISSEIADYGVRRELPRANLQPSVARLDTTKYTLEYLPLTTDMMLQAAAFWAQARQAAALTAPDLALDGDVILAAQTAILERTSSDPVVIATTNVGHLSRFATARLLHAILP